MARQEQALLQLVREVARRQIEPRANQRVAGDPFPAEVFALLAELDLLGLSFPVAEGGLGQAPSVVCRVLAELSRAFLDVALGVRVHLLSARLVADHAGAAMRADVLPTLVAGEWLGALGLGRPDGLAWPLRLRRDRDRYVVSGVQPGVVHAGHADCYVVAAGLDGTAGDGGTMLLLRADSGGVERHGDGGGATGGTDVTAALRCDDVAVPVADRLGAEGQAAQIVAELRGDAHLGLAACAVGIARGALDAAVHCTRIHGGRGDHAAGADVDVLADLAMTVEAAEALCERAAIARDAGRSASDLAALARLAAGSAAEQVAARAATVHAGAGCPDAPSSVRYRLDAATLRGIDGGHDAVRRTVGRAIVGDRGDDGS